MKFDTPVVREQKENLDGENGIELRRDMYCPVCGEPYIEEDNDEQSQAGT